MVSIVGHILRRDDEEETPIFVCSDGSAITLGKGADYEGLIDDTPRELPIEIIGLVVSKAHVVVRLFPWLRALVTNTNDIRMFHC